MTRALAMLLLCAALGGADVAPGCGSHHHERDIAPGDYCGGPSHCLESTSCVNLDQPLTGSGGTSSYVCTKRCGSDVDCAGLSVRMRCTGSGKPRDGSASEHVCLPAP